MAYISLQFRLVRKEKEIKLDLPKNYGASQYIRRLPCIRNEDPNFKNLIIDVVKNRSDLMNFLVTSSEYGKKFQENINPFVANGKLIRLFYVEH